MPTLLCLVALSVLFLKLPGVPDLIGLKNCASCTTATPYIPMFAAGYFAFLLTATLSFKSFPKPAWRWCGFVWAVGLAILLTYLSQQTCRICWIAHTCHILFWVAWKPKQKHEEMPGVKWALGLTASFAMMALFSTLNLTLLVYGIQTTSLVQEGSAIGSFALSAIASKDLPDYKGVVFQFVSPSCPYCKEQIFQLDHIAKDYANTGYRFITISQRLTPELITMGEHLEWVEDTSLSALLGVQGYPTLVMVDGSGVVLQAIAGASSNLERKLFTQIKR